MELQEAIMGRRSIRKYTDQDVSREQIDAILKAGYWAPRVNERWKFIVVRDEQARKILSQRDRPRGDKATQPHIANAPVDIVVCIDFRGASERDKALYAMQEASAAIQNMLLTAYELGLGTCWNGSFDDEGVKEILGLPDGVETVAIISFGYPAETSTGLRRKKLEEIVHRERYSGE